MKYKIYQINLTHAECIGVSYWNPTPKYDAHLSASLDADPTKGLECGFYAHVADIEANCLEGVFHIGNVGPEEAITRYDSMHSISVGDLVEDFSGDLWVVDKYGFVKVEGAEMP